MQQGSSFLAAMISNLLPQTSVPAPSVTNLPVSFSSPPSTVTSILQPVVSVTNLPVSFSSPPSTVTSILQPVVSITNLPVS